MATRRESDISDITHSRSGSLIPTLSTIEVITVLTAQSELSTWLEIGTKETSQLATRSTRHTVKSCDELTVVCDGVVTVTGQLADCQLADWTSRRLVNSRTRQLAH